MVKRHIVNASHLVKEMRAISLKIFQCLIDDLGGLC